MIPCVCWPQCGADVEGGCFNCPVGKNYNRDAGDEYREENDDDE